MIFIFYLVLFSAFAQPQAGTTVKFNPPQGQDTMVKNGVTQTINTKHQCITAMKEYETKSLEVKHSKSVWNITFMRSM